MPQSAPRARYLSTNPEEHRATSIWAFVALVPLSCLERPIVDVDPVTSNVFVTNVPISNVAAIDLLFVIDNSTSMADKQSLLKKAVPKMVERLVSPDCVTRDPLGNVTSREPSSTTSAGAPGCKEDAELEFRPVSDMHIGVITSSLGSHGRPEACDTIGTQKEPKTDLLVGQDKNDHAHLIPLVRPPDGPIGPNNEPPVYTGLSSDEPFLAWNGQGDVKALGTRFSNHVAAAGETGCGFESQLEAFYRFLIDPHPHTSVTIVDNKATPSTALDPSAVDAKLLSQRTQFLRPTSLVAVVLLTDENDCSIMEGGNYYPNAKFGYFAVRYRDDNKAVHLARPTSTCADNPNDPCCDTCARDAGRSGCAAIFEASCSASANPNGIALTPEQDDTQVRCFDQQRRFGVDLLYPVERYIDGLTRSTIVDSLTGTEVPNPLFVSASGAVRPVDIVYLAGIVGVPWQDIATPESLTNPKTLSYLSAEQLSKTVEGRDFSRWDVILGRPGHHKASRFCLDNPSDPSCGASPVPPLDPFMVESISAREAGRQNPIVSEEAITAPGEWNKINGSEQKNLWNPDTKRGADDLQYACIFPLGDFDAEKDAAECQQDGAACDCNADGVQRERPLCRPSPNGALEPAQYWGKAYPGLRILEVLKGLRPKNAIVASICPKVAEEGPSFGYNPAVTAIVDRLTVALGDQCLPRELDIAPGSSQVPCVVVETRARPTEHEAPLDCTTGGDPTGGRRAVDAAVERAVLDELVLRGACYRDDSPQESVKGGIPCSQFSMCEIQQLTGQDASECLEGSPTASSAGYCYVDPKKGLGNENLVATCPANQKRRLRFVSNAGPNQVPTPLNETSLFIACIGATQTSPN